MLPFAYLQREGGERRKREGEGKVVTDSFFQVFKV